MDVRTEVLFPTEISSSINRGHAHKTEPISSATAQVVDENESSNNFSCQTCLPCNPNRNLHRYVILCFVCMLTLGSYYCYESTTSLKRTLITVMGIDSSQYNILDSVYLWLNTFFPICGGVLIDRTFGIRIAMVTFCALICVGQLIVAIGGFVNLFWLMVFGRFVFGLGSENLQVARSTYTVMWFKPTELSTVFGFLFSVSRIGSTLDLNFNQKLYDQTFSSIDDKHKRLGSTLMVGFGCCLFSLLCAMVFAYFDKRAERILATPQTSLTGSVRNRYYDYVVKEKVGFRDIKDFPWLIFIICVIYYVTFIPFVGLATMFLLTKYELRYFDANIVNSFVYFVPAVVFPVIGVLIDKIGFNLIWLNAGLLIALAAHAIFAFLPSHVVIPYIAMCLIGIAYSMFACVLWPLIAFIVPEYQIGTAYGIALALENIGLTVVTILAGNIVEQYGYFFLELILQALLCLALTAGIILYVWDSHLSSNGILNMSGSVRAKLQQIPSDETEARNQVISTNSTRSSTLSSLRNRNKDSKLGTLE